MTPYHIVLAEDHLMFRQGVREILEENGDLKVVGEASDGLELLELLQQKTPDLIILDISMPKLQGVEATRRIKKLYPDVKVLILSMHKDGEYLHRAISAGAVGYLPKEGTDKELLRAVNLIRQGRTYISPLMALEPLEGIRAKI
jgi:DNA-binding NarL/FixJ family response regulator